MISTSPRKFVTTGETTESTEPKPTEHTDDSVVTNFQGRVLSFGWSSRPASGCRAYRQRK